MSAVACAFLSISFDKGEDACGVVGEPGDDGCKLLSGAEVVPPAWADGVIAESAAGGISNENCKG